MFGWFTMMHETAAEVRALRYDLERMSQEMHQLKDLDNRAWRDEVMRMFMELNDQLKRIAEAIRDKG